MGNSMLGKKAVAIAISIVYAFAALALAVLPQHAYAASLAAGNFDCKDGLQITTQSDYEYLDADNKIVIRDCTSGTYAYDASTKTITLNSVKAKTLSVNIEAQSFTLVLNGGSSFENVYSYSNLTVKGSGSVVASDSFNAFDKSVLTMTQGTIDGPVYAGSLVMRGGTIKGSGEKAKISVLKGNFIMSGGVIELASPKYTGISVSNGDFTVTGGTVNVTNANGDAISVSKYISTYASNSGKATISGGTLNLTVLTPKYGWAVSAASMSNKLGCIKTITGRLPYGAQFVAGKNLYKVMKSTSYVQLVKYNATAKKVKINKATYGKHSYDVSGIGANAFNTKTGKKVTSIAVNSYVTQIGSKAFANTKALKKLTFKSTTWIKRVYDKKYNLKKLKVATDCSVAKKAFAKAGKGGGKQLTVSLGKSGVWKKEAAKYKKFMKSKGLSGSAKLKQY